MAEKKLFLLDAFALIYRAYFAFGNNQRYNSKGLNTSAILGFTNTLMDVLNNQKPTHIAVVFDAPAVTNRELEFSDYKANRQEMPEDIRKAIPYIKKIIEAFHIPILMKEGYEADDVIGTLAKEAEKQGFITYMMTPDKDFGQLVTENIFIYKPARSGNKAEILGVKEVCKKFEVKFPKQVIDILGLWGDAVDNIPGIPGIGEKTAKKLIAQYGSIENLIEHANELKGKQKENVINFAEQGLLSKKLATIITDVPVEFNPEALKLEAPDEKQIEEIFSELEFRNLAKRILGKEIQITSAETGTQMDLFGQHQGVTDTENENEVTDFKDISNTQHKYHFVDTTEKRKQLIENLKQQKSFCFDTETSSIDALNTYLVGLSFSFKPHEAYYVPCPKDQSETQNIINEFKSIFEDNRTEKIGHNIKFDIEVLHNYGIEVKGKFFDTMIAHYLIQPDMRHNMDLLSEAYLGYKPISIEKLIGKKGKKQLSMSDIPQENICDYACEDADVTFQLKQFLELKLEEAKLDKVYYEIEAPLIKVLAIMEEEGIALDVEKLKRFSKELEELINKLQTEIITIAGVTFNLDSPKQLGEVLFEKLKIVEKPKKTKTGQYATSEDVLSKLASKHEIIGKILEYRTYRKLKNTYVDTLPELINPKTGRIHTSYMQTVAATGRLSSNNPNLQNIPVKTEMGRRIREAFVPRNENYKLLAADYSQIELRIIAALSKDENMINAFKNKEDIHSATASKVFNVPIEQVTREMRGKAKAVNFGIIYGVSAFGLAENLNISRSEAKEIIDNYFKQYPAIKAYMDESIEKAKSLGYVETIMGRRRILKDINSANAVVRGHAERNAINAPIQGSAADIIKIAMINIYNEFEKRNYISKMVLQVHDELVFDVLNDELEEIKLLVKDKMEHAVTLDVPLEVEMNAASNWLEAH
ncbi:MAG: DNA polymerase I [Vicingaceae bacterium]